MVTSIALIAATQTWPEFNTWIELVPMPPRFQRNLLSAMAVDFFGCMAIEAGSYWAFFDSKPRLLPSSHCLQKSIKNDAISNQTKEDDK